MFLERCLGRKVKDTFIWGDDPVHCPAETFSNRNEFNRLKLVADWPFTVNLLKGQLNCNVVTKLINVFPSADASGVAVKLPNLFKLLIVVNDPHWKKVFWILVKDVVCVVGKVIVFNDAQVEKALAKVVVLADTVAGSVIDVNL